MGLLVQLRGAPQPWSSLNLVHDDLTRRAVVPPDGGLTHELGECRVTTLDALADGSGTWRLVLPKGAAATVLHDHFALDAFLSHGALEHDQRVWPRFGYRRFSPGALVSLYARETARLWLKARPLPPWRRRALCVDAPRFDVSPMSGLDLCELCPAPDARVVLLRFPPGHAIGWHEHPRGEELVVVDGCLHDDRGVYPLGSWVRQPPGSGHEVRSPEGCLLYSHSAHLAR